MRIVLLNRGKHASLTIRDGRTLKIPPVFYDINSLFSDLANNAKHTVTSTSSNDVAFGN